MRLYTAEALSRILGLSKKEITDFVKAGVIQKGKTDRGLFDLEETAKELIAHYKTGQDNLPLSYQDERAKMMRAKRKAAEYDLGLREGDLHRTEDIETLLTQMLVNFKAKLSALPSKLAPVLANTADSTDAFDILKKAIDETQEELSDYDGLFQRDETL
jgi:hypothetical protein